METKMKTEQKRRVNLRIPKDLHIRAKHVADMADKTFTEYVIEALKEKLEKEG